MTSSREGECCGHQDDLTKSSTAPDQPLYPPNDAARLAPHPNPHCYALHYHFARCGHVSSVRFCSGIAQPVSNLSDYLTSCDDVADPTKPKLGCQIWHDIEVKNADCPWCQFDRVNSLPPSRKFKFQTKWGKAPEDTQWYDEVFKVLPLPRIGRLDAEVVEPIPKDEIERRKTKVLEAVHQSRAHPDWAKVRHFFKWRFWIGGLAESRQRPWLGDGEVPSDRYVRVEGPEVPFPFVSHKDTEYLFNLSEWETRRLDPKTECLYCRQDFGCEDREWLDEVGEARKPVRMPCGYLGRVRWPASESDMNEGEKLTTNHLYHGWCIKEWLASSPFCPECRVGAPVTLTLSLRYTAMCLMETEDRVPELLYIAGHGEWFDWQVGDGAMVDEEYPDFDEDGNDIVHSEDEGDLDGVEWAGGLVDVAEEEDYAEVWEGDEGEHSIEGGEHDETWDKSDDEELADLIKAEALIEAEAHARPTTIWDAQSSGTTVPRRVLQFLPLEPNSKFRQVMNYQTRMAIMMHTQRQEAAPQRYENYLAQVEAAESGERGA
jgi:hypothetical protein